MCICLFVALYSHTRSVKNVVWLSKKKERISSFITVISVLCINELLGFWVLAYVRFFTVQAVILIKFYICVYFDYILHLFYCLITQITRGKKIFNHNFYTVAPTILLKISSKIPFNNYNETYCIQNNFNVTFSAILFLFYLVRY